MANLFRSLMAHLFTRKATSRRRNRSNNFGIEVLDSRALLSAVPALISAPQAPTGMTTVYSQPADSSGTILKSSWYAPNGMDGDQYVWDNFTLHSTTAIKQINWTGGYTNYLSGAGQSPVSDFTISIYKSIVAGSQPDIINPPLVQYQVGGNADETASVVAGGVQLYNYHYVLPSSFTATAGEQYWVQIEASQGVTSFYGWPPDWGLASASGGDNSDFRMITGGSLAGGDLYYSHSGDAAFSLLTSSQVQATPTINVTGGPFNYNGQAHAATAVAIGTDGITKVSGTFTLGYFQNGVAASPVNAGTYDVVANFTSSNPAYASTSGTGQITINMITPSFSQLTSPTIKAGTSTVVVSGHLGSGTLADVGAFVGVKLGATTTVTEVDSAGNFSATLYTSGLGAGTYPLVFTCNATTNFNAPRNGSSHLQVNPSAPAVVTNPTPQTVVAGRTATFTAAATGSPVPTVQWQISKDAGKTFANITGATSTTLKFVTTSAMNGYQYRAVFTNSLGHATTAAAKLTVQTAPVVTVNPVNKTVLAGATVTFTAAATGNPKPTVQWQVSTDGGTTYHDITGATSATLQLTAAKSMSGNHYRARFKNTVATVYTHFAILTVH